MNKYFYDGIGARIRALRVQHNISRQVLADYAGLSWEDVMRIEQEDIMPSDEVIRKLETLLHTDANWLKYEQRRD